MSLQTSTRYATFYDSVLLPIDRTRLGETDVYSQARALGGNFTRISKGLPNGSVANFSPSLVKYHDNYYVAWRSQPEPFGFRHDMKYFYLNEKPTEIYIGCLADDETLLGTKKLRNKPHRLSYEDPRLFVGPDDELYVQFVGSTYASKYDSDETNLFHNPKVVVCHVNENFDAVHAAIPPIGRNRVASETEKNWCFFSHNGELNCIYATRPLIIERESGEPLVVDTSVLDSITGGAPTFNSTAPIDIGYGYLVFYHWKHVVQTAERPVLVYHLASYIVDKEFGKLLYVDRRPLFSGNPHGKIIRWTDPWGNVVSCQPAVILPFGALVEDDQLVMSLGVNDDFMGIFRCPLESILGRMEKVA